MVARRRSVVTSRSAIGSENIPPNQDRALQRRFVRSLTQAALAANVCDATTARLLRTHSKDAAVAYTMLTGYKQWFRKRLGQQNDYVLTMAAAERSGVFARRQRWGRVRSRSRHPGVRWGDGIFPDCRPSGSLYRSTGVPVTAQMLQQAVELAIAVILQEKHTICLAFRIVASWTRCRPKHCRSFEETWTMS